MKLEFSIVVMLSMLLAVNVSHVHAQTTNATATTTGQLPINLTKYFAQNKVYQFCPPPGLGTCLPAIDVLYQSPHTLALSSTYLDAIWKAVDFAKEQGYKVDGISTFGTNSGSGIDINVLVSMSR